ncbi:hypothetical protein DFR48_101206 [Ciceribacter lividus]|uniref:Uncharacterized protein n=1 Tax=Ciceribacter lividus TaxID=1197950 RepID=A0A6I7HVW0_9HYPH|nr:hypothetical protein DFR48_101206 [Ciceribacter lividus]
MLVHSKWTGLHDERVLPQASANPLSAIARARDACACSAYRSDLVPPLSRLRRLCRIRAVNRALLFEPFALEQIPDDKNRQSKAWAVHVDHSITEVEVVEHIGNGFAGRPEFCSFTLIRHCGTRKYPRVDRLPITRMKPKFFHLWARRKPPSLPICLGLLDSLVMVEVARFAGTPILFAPGHAKRTTVPDQLISWIDRKRTFKHKSGHWWWLAICKNKLIRDYRQEDT